MEVFNLATKEKQDEILSNFPISGGTDFSKIIPIITASSIEGTILEVIGKGYFFIEVPNYTATKQACGIKVTIDDDIVFNSSINIARDQKQIFIGDSFYQIEITDSFPWPLMGRGFGQSLKIEKTSGSASTTIHTYSAMEV